MALNATVRARVDEQLKNDVEAIFSQLGISTSQAITLFLKSVKRERGIPFELKIPNEETLKAMREVENGETESITFDQLKEEAAKCLD